MNNSTTDIERRLREIIDAWSFIHQLPEFARLSHGYGDSNGGFGVTYPGDLDEYQKVVEGIVIPDGMVMVYGYWGPPNGYEFLVSERTYLQVLARFLDESGYKEESDAIMSLADSRAN